MRTVLPVHSAQVETEIPIYERSSSGERKLRSEPSSRRVWGRKPGQPGRFYSETVKPEAVAALRSTEMVRAAVFD